MSTTKNTDGEDQFDLNSPLYAQNGKNPFRADDSYFNDFNTRLNNIIDSLEEIREEAPILCSIPIYNPFDAPAGYFDELPGKIQEIIPVELPRFSVKEWLLQLLKPNFAFPVFVTVLIAIAAIHFIDKQAKHTKTEITADVSLEEQLYPIDENLIVDILNDDLMDAEVKNSSDELITNYLIDNNVDETSLSIDLNTIEHEKK